MHTTQNTRSPHKTLSTTICKTHHTTFIIFHQKLSSNLCTPPPEHTRHTSHMFTQHTDNATHNTQCAYHPTTQHTQHTQHTTDTHHHNLQHKRHNMKCIIFHQKTQVPQANGLLQTNVHPTLVTCTAHMPSVEHAQPTCGRYCVISVARGRE